MRDVTLDAMMRKLERLRSVWCEVGAAPMIRHACGKKIELALCTRQPTGR